MTFRVELSDSALQDAEQLYEWVTEAAPLRGPLWFNRLIAAIESLTTFPERCAHATENDRFPFETRQLLFGRKPNVYGVVFTIDGDTVYVLCIRGPRQRLLQP
jgi:plasmid stabilization system protein ParE